MADPHGPTADALYPAFKIFALVADRSAVPGGFTRAVRVGTAGDLAVMGVDDSTFTVIPSVLGGETLPISIKAVGNSSDGTTASGLTGFR